MADDQARTPTPNGILFLFCFAIVWGVFMWRFL